MQFRKMVSAYYFRDFESEQFIEDIDNYIIEMISKMIKCEYDSLQKFWDVETGELNSTKDKIISSKDFINYQQNVENWLGEFNKYNSRNYYGAHYIYLHLMFLAINNELLITYDNRKKNEKMVITYIEKDMDLLKQYLKDFARDKYININHLLKFSK